MNKKYKEKWLNSQHTKNLLSYLRSARMCGGWWSPFHNEVGFSMDEIKNVLATREHIPNKEESYKLRVTKHKIGKTFRQTRGAR